MVFGRSDTYIKLEIIRRVMMLVVLALSIIFFDVLVAIAIGYIVSSFLDSIITTIPVKKLFGYGALAQYRDIWKSFICTALMALVVNAISLINFPSNILLLVIQIIAGLISYIVFNALFKVEGFFYCFNMIKGLLKKKKV